MSATNGPQFSCTFEKCGRLYSSKKFLHQHSKIHNWSLQEDINITSSLPHDTDNNAGLIDIKNSLQSTIDSSTNVRSFNNNNEHNDHTKNQNFVTSPDILYETAFRIICALHADMTLIYIQIQR